jgi:hypothetical protein
MEKNFSRAGTGILFAILVLLGLQPPLRGSQDQEKGYSHVRVVRLSFVDGTVLVKRPDSTEWAKASVNTPISQGFSLSTSSNSFAEVEFENGSTARLGELSQLDFTELALSPKGAKINQLTFDQGYATFHLRPEHGDEYSVKVANARVIPHGKAEFRTDFTQGRLRVEVFDGSAEVVGPTQTAKVTKDKVLEYDTNSQMAFDISHGIEKDAWDKWVQQRDAQTTLAWNDQPVGLGSRVYGWSDLDEYGEWAYFPGYGYGWAPFVGAGWTPFSMGQWSWYPGWGYTWISAEPWGWLPFHYGYWNYLPSFGYFWTPPTSFAAWNPGAVSWYAGGGYIGWVPVNAQGVPICSGAGCMTTVKATTLQNGAPVDPTTRIHVNPNVLAQTSRPPVAPSVLAKLSGTPVGSGVVFPGMAGGFRQQYLAVRSQNTQGITPTSRVNRSSVPSPARTFTTTQRSSVAAPRIILMGQSPSMRAASLSAPAHKSFFSRTFGSNAEPMRAQLGNTLGGGYRVPPNAAAGMMRGNLNQSAGMRGAAEPRFGVPQSASTPVFLSHRGSSGLSAPGPRMTSGGIRMQGSSGGRMVAPTAPTAPSGGYGNAPSMSAGHPAASAGPHR